MWIVLLSKYIWHWYSNERLKFLSLPSFIWLTEIWHRFLLTDSILSLRQELCNTLLANFVKCPRNGCDGITDYDICNNDDDDDTFYISFPPINCYAVSFPGYSGYCATVLWFTALQWMICMEFSMLRYCSNWCLKTADDVKSTSVFVKYVHE